MLNHRAPSSATIGLHPVGQRVQVLADGAAEYATVEGYATVTDEKGSTLCYIVRLDKGSWLTPPPGERARHYVTALVCQPDTVRAVTP